jgi:alpha-beta hydrolase superfamily lysophospholipase
MKPLRGTNLFLVLADSPRKKRNRRPAYDKREHGQSTGNYEQASMSDLAGDAQAAMNYLKGRKEVDPKRVGILAHSEGGIMAAQIAAKPTIWIGWCCWRLPPLPASAQLLSPQSELIARTGGLPEEANRA